MPLFETISLLLNVTGSAKLLAINSTAQTSAVINANSAAKTASKAGERMVTGAACIPDPEKAGLEGGCGEDAFFISSDASTIGLSDGVGGWRSKGIDSSAYSRCLMRNSREKAEKGENGPLPILKHAYNQCKPITGSATAAVVSLKEDGMMDGLNLGDSGFAVIRNGKMVLRTKEQQWGWNAPYQLGTGSDDRPHHGDRYTLQTQPNDVIIMGTDGVWDNLHDHQILDVYNKWNDANFAKNGNPRKLASMVAHEAYRTAMNPDARTPFEAGSGGRYPGGKMDDITVVVGVVRP